MILQEGGIDRNPRFGKVYARKKNRKNGLIRAQNESKTT